MGILYEWGERGRKVVWGGGINEGYKKGKRGSVKKPK